MLRRVIQTFAFVTLLGITAVYALASTLVVLLIADGLAQNSVVWPHIMSLVG